MTRKNPEKIQRTEPESPRAILDLAWDMFLFFGAFHIVIRATDLSVFLLLSSVTLYK